MFRSVSPNHLFAAFSSAFFVKEHSLQQSANPNSVYSYSAIFRLKEEISNPWCQTSFRIPSPRLHPFVYTTNSISKAWVLLQLFWVSTQFSEPYNIVYSPHEFIKLHLSFRIGVCKYNSPNIIICERGNWK